MRASSWFASWSLDSKKRHAQFSLHRALFVVLLKRIERLVEYVALKPFLFPFALLGLRISKKQEGRNKRHDLNHRCGNIRTDSSK